MVGKGSVNHNSRKFKAENVDGSRTHGGRKVSLWRENIAEDVSMCDDRDNLFENDGDV